MTYDPRMTARGAAMLLVRQLRHLGHDANVLPPGTGGISDHWCVKLKGRWAKKQAAGEGILPLFPRAGEDWRAVALSAEVLCFQPTWAESTAGGTKKRARMAAPGTIQVVEQQTPTTGKESSMSKNTATKNPSTKTSESKEAKSVTRDAQAVADGQAWAKLVNLLNVMEGPHGEKNAKSLASAWKKLEAELGRKVSKEEVSQQRGTQEPAMKVPPTTEENEAAAKAIAEQQSKVEAKPATKPARRADGSKPRGAPIEIGKTASGKRVSSPENRFAAVRNAVQRGQVEVAVSALKRALPAYTKQDYLDAAKVYADGGHKTMAEMCEAVGRNMD